MNNKIVVRSYQESDATALAAIYYHTIHQINSQHYSVEQINAWAPASSLQPDVWKAKWQKLLPLVAIDEGEIIGFAEFESNGHIDCFYIHHQYQGQGAGWALIKAIEGRAQNEQIPRLYAEVSITAKPFFERCGFSVSKQQKVLIRGAELTNYKMEKWLSANTITITALTEDKIPSVVAAFKKSNWTIKSATLFEHYLLEQQQQQRLIWLAYCGNYFAGYITLKWESYYPPFYQDKIPEIMDLNVLPKFRNIGIGSLLLDKAEQECVLRSKRVGIGVGLYADYGPAQYLYIKRGYLPDGRGVTYNYKATLPGEDYCLDDDLILWLTKTLKD
ncbi:GNAT family N-acetyltransferase [Legionella sp. D16C41]|uniref:GNAT family N-acetyltransferase n=1 Tax=Legionella sp. D16C41 TaxID=3402688 RepID=UPI003AF42F08